MLSRRGMILGLFVALLAPMGLPASHGAEPVVVTFETGPPADTTPVTDEYLRTHFVQFFRDDPGFRPYRRQVGTTRARSGSFVVDVGADVCTMEVADPQSCEFPGAGTMGRLSRTATSVTLYAGLFRTTSTRQVTARLVALSADGSTLASSAAVPVNATNFRTEVTVTRPAGDIAAFRLHAEGPGATGGSTLGFDDLSFTFPDNSLPDVSLTVGAVPELLQARSANVPVVATRLNGSNGPLRLSVSGLPSGVTGTFTPNPLTGTNQNAVLRLTATSTAPVRAGPFTVTADPQGNNSVAPAPRSDTAQVRVSSNFDIEAVDPGPAQLPHCAPVEFPLRVPRAQSFRDVITLSAENLPTGVEVAFLPDNTLGPEGPLTYLPRLQLRRQTGGIPAGANVRVRASGPNAPDRTLLVPVAAASPTALVGGSRIGIAPMRERPGSKVTLTGNGFCPGTTVRVGNTEAVAPATVAPDGRSLEFRVPRLATDGRVTVVPPGAATYRTVNALDVRTFRSYYGLQFDNFGWGSLSWGELVELVGEDDLYLKANPCWPFYDCSIPTPFRDPMAVTSWLVMKPLVRETGGHCYGMVRAIQELLAGRERYDRFEEGVDHPYALGNPTGPGSELRHYLDARHAGQLTVEMIRAFVKRDKDMGDQIQQIRDELAAGRYPGVSIFRPRQLKGHVVLAYDVEQTADGFDVYVYDDNIPYEPGESDHEAKETGNLGVIHITGGRWTFKGAFDEAWSGGGATFWTIPLSAEPNDPSLASLGTLGVASIDFLLGQFASTGGAATIGPIPAGAEWLPVLEPRAPGGTAGTLIGPRSAPLVHTVQGTKEGRYSELLVGDGFSGAVLGVPTGAGVEDRLALAPQRQTLAFAGTDTRPLTMMVATDARGGATRTATLRTTTTAGGREQLELSSRVGLVYEHRGAAAPFSVELTHVQPSGGIAEASTPSLRVAPGDTVTLKPTDWAKLSKVRLTVRGADGSTKARVVRLRQETPNVRVRIGDPRIRNTPRREIVVVKTRFGSIPAGTVGGMVQELRKGKRVVASRSVAMPRMTNGVRKDRWRLPNRVSAGAYRMVVRVTVVTGGRNPGTLTVDRSVAVQVPR